MINNQKLLEVLMLDALVLLICDYSKSLDKKGEIEWLSKMMNH